MTSLLQRRAALHELDVHRDQESDAFDDRRQLLQLGCGRVSLPTRHWNELDRKIRLASTVRPRPPTPFMNSNGTVAAVDVDCQRAQGARGVQPGPARQPLEGTARAVDGALVTAGRVTAHDP